MPTDLSTIDLATLNAVQVAIVATIQNKGLPVGAGVHRRHC
jgi:hypothetical protein